MAEAIFKGAVFVCTLLEPTTREDGRIVRYFPKTTESAGKPLRSCEYIAVHLILYAPGDDAYLAQHDSRALCQRKIKRITDKVAAQGAPATQEDLASLLGCHRSASIRNIAEMKARGIEWSKRPKWPETGAQIAC